MGPQEIIAEALVSFARTFAAEALRELLGQDGISWTLDNDGLKQAQASALARAVELLRTCFDRRDWDYDEMQREVRAFLAEHGGGK